MDSLASKYYFTHKSGRKIIAQSSNEFYALQMGKSEYMRDVPEYVKSFEPNWGGRSPIRTGYKEWRNNPGKEQADNERRSEAFWKKCVGYERLGNNYSKTPRDSRLSFGYYGCPLLNFLRDMANHSVMMGDKEGYDKAYSLMPRGNQLALPASV